MWLLWCKNALKYVFSSGSPLDPTGEALTAFLDSIRLVEMGEIEEVSPGPVAFWGLAVTEKLEQIVCPFH